MRAITVRQPWAWAIVHGGKDVENRSRNIAGSYRGPVAIHAGKAFDPAAWNSDPFDDAFRYAVRNRTDVTAHEGALIGVADLVDVHRDDTCYQRDIDRLARLYREDPEAFRALPDNGAGGLVGRVRHCSPWAEVDGVMHLVLANPRPLPEPIPYRGRLGLWTLPDDVLTGVA